MFGCAGGAACAGGEPVAGEAGSLHGVCVWCVVCGVLIGTNDEGLTGMMGVGPECECLEASTEWPEQPEEVEEETPASQPDELTEALEEVDSQPSDHEQE